MRVPATRKEYVRCTEMTEGMLYFRFLPGSIFDLVIINRVRYLR